MEVVEITLTVAINAMVEMELIHLTSAFVNVMGTQLLTSFVIHNVRQRYLKYTLVLMELSKSTIL